MLVGVAAEEEICTALQHLAAGNLDQVDVVRLLELTEHFKDLGESYWAALAEETAYQAMRPLERIKRAEPF